MQYFLSILVCLLLISLARPARAAFEQELILDNSLKVIMAPQPANPLLTVRLVVRTGSGGEEDRADFGLAHLIEHMAFKSTAGGRAEGQIAWEVESAGGTISAYTWLDETVYHLTLPAEDAEKAFDILRDMVFFPLMTHRSLLAKKRWWLRRSKNTPICPATSWPIICMK